MQEIRSDGTEKLTQVDEKEIPARVRKMLSDKDVVSVRIHKPGAVFTSQADGKKYRVLDDGRLTLAQSNDDRKKKRKAEKAARKKNRR